MKGLQVFLSDNISVKGQETTCGSKMLSGYKPVFNATVVEKLENAGLIFAGRLKMNEFAPGGNIMIHNDSPCVTSIKPTYGSVSRFGFIGSTSSLEQISVAGKNISDCASLLSIISGPDEKDTSCLIKEPFEFNLNEKNDDILKLCRIGVPVNNPAVFDAAKELEKSGAIIEEFEMPLMDFIIPVYTIISSAEISSNLAKYDGLKYGYRSEKTKTLADLYRLSRSEAFGIETKKRIMLGSFVLSSENYENYFVKALKGRTLIKNVYNDLFKRFDIIITPVNEVFTASINLAGLPAVVLPNGFQLIGDSFSENKLVNAARIYEEIYNSSSAPPRLCVNNGDNI